MDCRCFSYLFLLMKYRETTTPIIAPTKAPPQEELPAPPSIVKKNVPAITAHPNIEWHINDILMTHI